MVSDCVLYFFILCNNPALNNCFQINQQINQLINKQMEKKLFKLSWLNWALPFYPLIHNQSPPPTLTHTHSHLLTPTHKNALNSHTQP